MTNEQSKIQSIETQLSEKKRSPAKGFYVIPSLFTSAGLFAGFYAIMQSRLGHFEAACLGIYVAMIMDVLDGRMARLTNTSTKFGSEYDSLSDMVSFGVAPALVMYEFVLNQLGRGGSLVAFIFVACAALRLARFNVITVSDKRYFIGLPSPGAAGLIASCVWVMVDYQIDPTAWRYFLTALTAIAALSMVSNAPYRSFKDFDFKNKMPFVGLIFLVLIIAVIYLDPPSAFLIVGSTYMLSGLISYVIRKLKKQARKTTKLSDHE